jgi:hypothetical protein
MEYVNSAAGDLHAIVLQISQPDELFRILNRKLNPVYFANRRAIDPYIEDDYRRKEGPHEFVLDNDGAARLHVKGEDKWTTRNLAAVPYGKPISG